MAWLLSLGAVSGYSDRLDARNPRWVKFCAAAASDKSTGKSARASLATPQCLDGEILVLHGNVVFQFFELQHGAALAVGIVDFHCSRGPDAADVLNIAVVDAADEFVPGIAFDLRAHEVVFANPNQ